jgi:hypothetical protein
MSDQPPSDAAASFLELTAPAIQAIAREGLARPLTPAERLRLCRCVLFHVDNLLDVRRMPRVGPASPGAGREGAPSRR